MNRYLFNYSFLPYEDRKLYQHILNDLSFFRNPICAYNAETARINQIIRAILMDNPQLFWFEGKWHFQTHSGQNYIYPLYILTQKEILPAQSNLRQLVSEISFLKADSEFIRAKTVFDWLISNVGYNLNSDSGQNIYDALIKRNNQKKRSVQRAFQSLSVFAGES